MKKNNKKGFTIVELVIVIAVIAILAAVLIPTFSSIIKKAKVNNDIQLVRNLNTALATDTKEHKTMQSALDAAFEFGYDVAKINDTSVDENKILWDSKNDVFCYLKDSTLEYVPNSVADGDKLSADSYLLWTISKTVDTTFSTYLYKYQVTETPVIALKGLDVGETEGITEIKYENNTDQKVVIRTNGGTLTVKAPSGTVNHYGEATIVTVTEIAPASYHENGKVDEIKLAKGRVVVESNGEVGSVMVTATDVSNIKIENNGTLGGVAASDGNVANGLKNNVTGVDENKVLTEAVDNSEFAGGLGTESSPFLINTLDRFLCVKSGKTNNKAYYKVLNDLDFSAKTGYVLGYISNVEIDGNGNTFSGIGGTGTKYAAVVRSLTNSVIRNIDLVYSCTTAGSAGVFAEATNGNVTFDNVDVYGTINYDYEGRNQSPYLVWPMYGTLTFNECNTYATINCTEYDSLFVGNLMRSNTLTVNIFNCANYGALTGKWAAIVVGNTSGVSANHTINIENTKNYGEVYGLEKAGFVFYETTNARINGNIENAQKPETGRTGVCGVIPKLEGMALELNANKEIILSPSTSNTVDIAYYVITASQYVETYYGNTRNGTDIISISKRIENNDLGEKVNTGMYKYEFRQTSTDLPNGAGAKYTLDGAYSFTAEQIANRDYATVESNGEHYYLFANNHQPYIGSLDLVNLDLVNVIRNPVPTIRAYAYDSQGNLLGMVTLDK